MKVVFNLASQPYENLRPYHTAGGIALTVGVVLALLLVGEERQHRSETRSLTQQLSRFEKELEDLNGEQQVLEQWLRRPDVQKIRDHSVFLNSLILRKSLSWTRMFLDLEKILPAKVQVTAIRPHLNQSQQPELSLTVTAAEMGPLVELLKNLESSSQFGSPAVESQRFATDRAAETHVILELSTQYQQSLPEAPSPEAAPAGAPERADSSTPVADAAAVRPGVPGSPRAAEQKGSR